MHNRIKLSSDCQKPRQRPKSNHKIRFTDKYHMGLPSFEGASTHHSIKRINQSTANLQTYAPTTVKSEESRAKTPVRRAHMNMNIQEFPRSQNKVNLSSAYAYKMKRFKRQ